MSLTADEELRWAVGLWVARWQEFAVKCEGEIARGVRYFTIPARESNGLAIMYLGRPPQDIVERSGGCLDVTDMIRDIMAEMRGESPAEIADRSVRAWVEAEAWDGPA